MLYAITMITNSIWFEVAAKPSESDSRKRGIFQRQACEFSPKARFPCFDLVLHCFTKRNKSELFRKSKLVRICFLL